jgi:heat shock protein HslJ
VPRWDRSWIRVAGDGGVTADLAVAAGRANSGEEELTRHVPGALAAWWLLGISACGPKPPASESPPAASNASLDDREWALVELGEVAASLGAGGRPATIQFDPTTSRATGFAGCNRYSAGYTLTGDSLTFGPAIATKMACAEGDELERDYLAMLPSIRSYALSDSTLILNGPDGPLARFRAP